MKCPAILSWLLFLGVSVFGVSAESNRLLLDFTFHEYLRPLYNPSYSGEAGSVRFRLGTRLQNVGLDRYPKNFVFSADMPVASRVGDIGAALFVSKINEGFYSNFFADIAGSWHFKAGKGFVSVGLDVGYIHSTFNGEAYNQNLSEVNATLVNPDDASVNESVPDKKMKAGAFDLGVGVSYFSPSFHVGLSVLKVNSPSLTMKSSEMSSSKDFVMKSPAKASLYFDLGGNIELKHSLFTIQPALLVATEFSDFSAQLSVGAVYNKILNFGVSYRTREAVSPFIGLTYKGFLLGYAFGIPAGSLSGGSKGSHEVVIGYEFKPYSGRKNPYSHKSVRIM